MSEVAINSIEGVIRPPEGKVAIIAARFNAFVVDQMVAGAQQNLLANGMAAENILLVKVPGAFELPLVSKTLAARDDIAAVIALGCVIRGDTAHFDFVAGEASAGISRVSLETNKPVAFGVLTTDTVEQALARASMDAGNKGADAAMVALEMCDLLQQL
ncbi:MAG: 6,7-dimethyl-8-ribityllumazine synthase, partial [Xanthomonadales bacterium]|nr:6,7-dimethyl-8-ribityllumazine synthase [Xanthomonadales bacterium]